MIDYLDGKGYHMRGHFPENDHIMKPTQVHMKWTTIDIETVEGKTKEIYSLAYLSIVSRIPF